MLSNSKTIWLVLLTFMAALAWGAEDSQTFAKAKANTANNKKLASQQYRAANFWGRRVVPGASRGYYGEDDEDEDEDDGGYYGESYGSYEPSYAPQPQIIQLPAQSYYQQQQPSIIPIPYPSYQGYGGSYGHKKKKKKPICCCSTDKCLEGCDPATNMDCACDIRCCRKYSATNPGCTAALMTPRQIVFLRRFDNLSDDEETPEEE